MPLKKTVAMERRIDLASLFCMIARHGPAVLLTLVGIGCVVAGFVIFKNMREKRRRRRAGEADRRDTSAAHGDAAVGLGEKEETDGIRRGSTDASDDSSPDDVKEHTYLSQVRQRRTTSERKSYKHNQPDQDTAIDKPQHTFFWEWNSHRTQSYAEEAVQKSSTNKSADDVTQEVHGARETELMKEAASEEEERMPEADSSEDITTTNEDVSEEEFRQEETVQFTFNSQPCSYPIPNLSVDDSKENTKETNSEHLESEFENAPVLAKEELPSAPYKEDQDYIGDQTNCTNEQSSGVNNEKHGDKPCNDKAISTSVELKEGLLLAASQNHEPSKLDQTKDDVNFKPSDTADITDFSLNSQQSEVPASPISDTQNDQSGRCPQEQSHHRSEVQPNKDLSSCQKDTEKVNNNQAFPDTIPSDRIDASLVDAIPESLDITVTEDESAVNQDTSKIAETEILSENKSLQDQQCQEIVSQVMDGKQDNSDSLIDQKDMTEEQQIQPICKETELNVDQIEVQSSSVGSKEECLPLSPNQLTEVLDKNTSSSTLSTDVKTETPSISDTTEPSNDLKGHGLSQNLDTETTITDSGLGNESKQADQSASTDTREISTTVLSDKIECIVEQIVADAYKEVRQTSLEPKSAQMKEKTVEQPSLVQQPQRSVITDNQAMASNAIQTDSGKVFKEEGKEDTFCSNMAAQITEEVVNTLCSLELSNRKKLESDSQKDTVTSNASEGISQINVDSKGMTTVQTDLHVQEMNQEERVEQETLNTIESEASLPLGDINMEGEVLMAIKAETVENLEKSQQKTLAEINNGLSNTESEVENILPTKEENQPENTPVTKMEILENSENGVQSDRKESSIPIDTNKHVSNLTEKKVVIVCRTVEASATAIEMSDGEDVDGETYNFEPKSSEFSVCQHHLEKKTPANEEVGISVVACCDTLSTNALFGETTSQEAGKNSDLTSGAALDFSQDNTTKSTEQVMLNDNGITSPSLESGISSMTVSPEVEEASKEIGKIIEEFEPILSSQDTLSTCHVFHSEERVSHSLLTSDGVVTVTKEDAVTMVIGSLASSPVQLSTPEDISNESLVTNEDSFGSEIEDDYQKAMEEIIMQVVDNIKTISNDMTEVVKKVEEKKEQACAVSKEEGEKVDSEKTEISIMEATMDHNEWIIDGSYQVLPWMNATSSRDTTFSKEGVDVVESKPPAQASTTEDSTENARKILAVQPMPQNVNVTFRVHYLPLTPYQTVGVTGDQEELGAWKSIVPLEKTKDGYWSCVVGLPAETHVEWKFVVLDKGEVCRWEECGNRLLYTGYGDDLLVHKWWGFL
ncbi:hypothetical protein NL108_014401 [Boleophthalmus pectinirostris]|nr:hypothetical protein NL108_014401 [Boleophthalmus pectinirostris]